MWKQPGGGLDVSLDERFIAFSTNSGVAVPDVGGILQKTCPVGADIEHDRDHPCGIHAAGGGVDCQLADGYLDTADSPVADSQHLLGIRGTDQVDIARADAERA